MAPTPHLIFNNSILDLLDDDELQRNLKSLTLEAKIFCPILAILFLLGVVGNIFTIFSIACIKRLRTFSNILSINLAISDIITATAVNAILAYNLFKNSTDRSMSSITCEFTGYASSITPLTSLTILCTIASQRYLASSQNARLKAINKKKMKMAGDLILPWVIATIIDVLLNKVMNDGHFWDPKIHMCIYVHTDWRVSAIHFVYLVGCTLLVFTSDWSLSKATYRWPSVTKLLQSRQGDKANGGKKMKEKDAIRGRGCSFYISVAGKTVPLQNYQASKNRASLRRTLLLLVIFIVTCFPWYILALMNSIKPLSEWAPILDNSYIWLTAAILEHSNCSLNFFINSAFSRRYRSLVAQNVSLPPVISQRLVRATQLRLRRNSSRLGSFKDFYLDKTGRNVLSRASLDAKSDHPKEKRPRRATTSINLESQNEERDEELSYNFTPMKTRLFTRRHCVFDGADEDGDGDCDADGEVEVFHS